jgi:Endonuclease-reverse transcriptase
MNHSNFKLIALLETTIADCILTQEPWWGSLIPRHSNSDPDSMASHRTVAHPHWVVFSPPPSSSPNSHPHVITFIRKQLLSSFSVTPIPDLSSYDLFGLHLRSTSSTLQLNNFYHHIQHHKGNLNHLLEASLDHSIPIILGSDFNMHFDTWGPGGKHTSPWAATLEQWIDDNRFISTVPENAISCRLTTSNPSLIDFIFVNESLLEVPLFPFSCSVLFDLSMGSDHAGLLLPIPFTPIPPALFDPPGWKLDPAKKEEWCSWFHSTPLPDITVHSSLHSAAHNLLAWISDVSDSLFQKKSPPTDRNLPWWFWECSLACAALKSCHWQQ